MRFQSFFILKAIHPFFFASSYKSWVKGSDSTEHPVRGDELRAIKRYLATRDDRLPWLFVSERGQQMVRQTVNHILREAGCCATRPATPSPTRVMTSGCFRPT